MALIAAQMASPAGTLVAYAAAAAGGDTFAPNDHSVFLVRNGSGVPITVTIAVPGNTRYGLAAPDIATVVAAGTDRAFGPFPSDLADLVDFLVHVTYTAVATVTVALISH